MLSAIAVGFTIVGVSVFGLAYIWAIFIAQSIDKRADLDHDTRRKMVQLSLGYTPLDDAESLEGVSKKSSKNRNGSKHRRSKRGDDADADESSDEDDGSDASDDEESGKLVTPINAIRRMSRRNGGGKLRVAHRHVAVREFHRSAVAALALVVFSTLMIYHLLVLTGVFNLIRPIDGVTVNIWRWIVGLSIPVAVMHALVGFACQHHATSILFLAMHGFASRVLFGLALWIAPGSVYFWIVFALGCLIGAIAFVSVWFHRSKHVAGPSSFVGMLTLLAIPVTLAVHAILLLTSVDAFGVTNYSFGIILTVVADALLFLLPGLYIISKAYYRNARVWPLLPHSVYADYGLELYWQIEAKPDLLHIHEKVRAEIVQTDAPGKVRESFSVTPDSIQNKKADL